MRSIDYQPSQQVQDHHAGILPDARDAKTGDYVTFKHNRQYGAGRISQCREDAVSIEGVTEKNSTIRPLTIPLSAITAVMDRQHGCAIMARIMNED